MAYEKVGRSFVYHAAARTGSISKRFFVAERRENKAQEMTFHNQKMDKVELSFQSNEWPYAIRLISRESKRHS